MELAVLLILLTFPLPLSPVQIEGLVVNGGFETGDLSSWTVYVPTVETCGRGSGLTGCWWIGGMIFTSGVVSPAFEGSHMLRIRSDSGSSSYREGLMEVFQDLSSLRVPSWYQTTLQFYANVKRPDISTCPDCYGSAVIQVFLSNGTRSTAVGRTWGTGETGGPGTGSFAAQTIVNGALNVVDISAELPADVKNPHNNYVFTELNIFAHSKHSGHEGFGVPSYTEADWDAIRITAIPPVREVGIDIKPSSFPNSINSESRGKIPVAILSSEAFDAPSQVNATSLTFGKTGDEQSLAFCRGSEDVNGDGLLDLVCHFYTQRTSFQSGDPVGILRGKLLDGTRIEGQDSVRIVMGS